MEKKLDDLLKDKTVTKILQVLLVTFKLENNFFKFSKYLNVSSPTLKIKLDNLIKHKIIYKQGVKVRLTCDKIILDMLDKKIPLKKSGTDAKIEKLQRKLVRSYIDKQRTKEQKDIFFIKRPKDNFDIKESITPSLSIAHNFQITAASKSFYLLFDENELEGKGLNLLEFFKDKILYLYDFENDIIENKLIYKQVYRDLLKYGTVNLDACYVKESGEKMFLNIFMIIQTNFLGIQAIINDITQKVQNNRVKQTLTHRFYHLISVIGTITEELHEPDIDNNRQDFLIEQLGKLSSYDYLETMYASNRKPTRIDHFRDFRLNSHLHSIIRQLKFLYGIEKDKVCLSLSDEELTICKTYDVYLYEGLYLLIENLITLSHNHCNFTIHTYKNLAGVICVEIRFPNKILYPIMKLIKSLQGEIIKGVSIKESHLNLKVFLDSLSKQAILELTVANYFQDISIENENRSILLKFK
jgi:hypothetical protein